MAADLALNLPPDTSAARVARAAAKSYLAGKVGSQRLSELTVVVSELVSNALEHGRGQVVSRLRFDEGTVYGEVIDEGGGFEHEIPARGPGEVRGRGLFMVAALTKCWGIHEGTTHVWFEFAAGLTIPSGPLRGSAKPSGLKHSTDERRVDRRDSQRRSSRRCAEARHSTRGSGERDVPVCGNAGRGAGAAHC